MARHNLSTVIRYLQQLTRTSGVNGASDAELLERYVRCRDEAAFELLVWRHGALVFNVCSRILPCQQDAEDAFQATFLAFVRKAGSIRRCGSVASWLYKVAYRVALEARERRRKTAAIEKPGGEILAVQAEDDPLWNDVRPILDEELNRLPERLRQPIVLCYLEGKSNAEAARELGCRLGTVYSRLSRGRELLRQRLQRRGVTMPAAALATALTARATDAAPAISLVRTAARAALAFADPSATPTVPPRVATLAEGVLRTMFVTKLKITAVMLLVICAAAGGVLTQARTEAPQARAKADDPPPKPAGGDKKNSQPIAVKVVKPKKGGQPLMVTRPADVVAAQLQQIVPLVSGTIKEVRVDIGDAVKKGQVLLVLDAPLLGKEVEEAEASLELARAQMEEAEAAAALAEAQHEAAKIDASRLVQAKASLKASRARVRLAQAVQDKVRIQEGFTQLKAAFDGVVTRRTADVGNYVQPSDSRLLQPLLTVQRIDMVRILFQAYNNEASLIKRGMSAKLWLAGIHGSVYKVSRFSPSLEGSNREMVVEIDLPNADHRLLPGMTGEVKMPLQETSPESLIVPLACLGSQYPPFPVPRVYIVRDGKAYARQVTVNYRDSENAEISKGLSAADLVITNPENLESGTPVKIEKAP
ncbi:MAG TPA: efflux RND transporter periplasmic adaptor subunit [Gemmataceae bacterium]|jgi:RND family efflux transporter MFP subunit